MIYYSSLDAEFPYKQCEDLYEVNDEYLFKNKLSFKELIDALKGNFWAVCNDENSLVGCIYFEIKNEKWHLSGFSKRKVTKYVKEAIDTLINHYGFKELYSIPEYKQATYSLLRCGFEKIGYNLYIRRMQSGI